jgi:transcription initiation factor TFIIH subunit 3
MASQDDSPSLLVVIAELDPFYTSDNDEESSLLTFCLSNLLAFISSYLMVNHENRLAFIVATPSESTFLYPTESKESAGTGEGNKQESSEQFELFGGINSTIMMGMKRIVAGMDSSVTGRPLLAGALAKSLCYIHKQTTDKGKHLPRILVLKLSPDSPSHYMPTMNCIFAAQKNSVPIDACLVNSDSGFLQQVNT